MKVTGEGIINNKVCCETVDAVIDEKASSSCDVMFI
jgi:hypothetical protein